MSHLEVPRFPRGFVLSHSQIDVPPTYVPGPLLPNFYVHPWTNIEVAGNLQLFVIILGHAVPTRPDQTGIAAQHLLECLRRGEGEFLDALADYGGRHAMIFGSAGNIGVVNDATGMRSVFYAAEGGVVASHAALVERALGGDIIRTGLPFSYGYPGNRTPYVRTKILTPNTYYWMTANVVRRFWPITTLQPRTVEEAATALLHTSTASMRAMTQGERRVTLTLTAGIDSRAALAAALNAGTLVHAYTYSRDDGSQTDRLIAEELAQRFGFEHTVIQDRIEDPELSRRLSESHYYAQHFGWVPAIRKFFPAPHDISIMGSLLELGRNHYGPSRKRGGPGPVSAQSMTAMHTTRNFLRSFESRLEAFGFDRYKELSEEAFQGFIDDTGFVPGILDPYSQFYWEHRMPTWMGVSMGERDFYAIPFIPFNSRRMFETMLGAPAESMSENAAVKRMIEMVDPGLLDLPINPKTWPMAQEKIGVSV